MGFPLWVLHSTLGTAMGLGGLAGPCCGSAQGHPIRSLTSSAFIMGRAEHGSESTWAQLRGDEASEALAHVLCSSSLPGSIL